MQQRAGHHSARAIPSHPIPSSDMKLQCGFLCAALLVGALVPRGVVAEPPSNSYLPPNRLGGGGRPSGSYGAPSSFGGPSGGGYGGGGGYDDQSEPAKYEFMYEVDAPEFGNQFGHQERREGDLTQGSYHVLLPDGRVQTVQYVADANGYRPQVSYQGTARPGGFGGGAGGFGGGAGGYGGGQGGAGGFGGYRY